MFRLYSKGCAHALKALSAIPAAEAQKTFTASRLCRKAGVPESFTRKTLQLLSQAGYLRTVTGPKGGYSFKVPPKKISLLKLIEVIEGKDNFQECILGLAACNDRQSCSLHKSWTQMRAQLKKSLKGKTLEDLMSLDKKPL